MDIELTLPCGVLVKDGSGEGYTVERDVTIRGMTAGVKKELGKKTIRTEPSKAQDIVLQSCVVSIGGKTEITKNMIQGMLAGDRDYLLFQIRKHSLGGALNGRIACINPSCGEVQGLSMDIDNDFKVYSLPDTMEIFTPENQAPYRTFSIDDDEYNLHFVFRHETGHDRRAVASLLQANQVEAKMVLMGRTLISGTLDGIELVGPVGPSVFDKMDLAAYDRLSVQYDANCPGIDLTVEANCVACGTLNSWEIDASDFFGQSGVSKKLQNKSTLRSGQSASLLQD